MASQALDESYCSAFAGKRILVTGAGKGLGYAIVKRFYESGATVFALDKNKKALDELKTEFPGLSIILVDLRDWDETRRLVKTVAPIDHLVNNAAITQTSYFEEVAPEQIDELFGVNVKAVVNVSQVVVKGLKEAARTHGATIVNVSSVFDAIPSKGICMYSSTKAALLMLTKKHGFGTWGAWDSGQLHKSCTDRSGQRNVCVPQSKNYSRDAKDFGQTNNKTPRSAERSCGYRPILIIPCIVNDDRKFNACGWWDLCSIVCYNEITQYFNHVSIHFSCRQIQIITVLSF